MMQVLCIECGQPLEFGPERAGQAVECWRCRAALTLPGGRPPPPPPPTPPPQASNPFQGMGEQERPAVAGRAHRPSLPWGAPEALGEPSAEYRAHLWWPLAVVSALAFLRLLPFLVICVIGLVNLQFVHPPMICGGFLGGLCLFGCFVGLTGVGRRLIVCRNGLIDRGYFGWRAVMWDEVEAVVQEPVGLFPILTGGPWRSTRVTLYLVSGEQFYFTTAYIGTRVLVSRVQELVAEAQFPRARQALQAGKRLQFGAVSLSLEGISSGGGLLPAHECRRAEVERDSSLVIHDRQMGGAWAEAPLRSVENLGLLLRLLEWLRGPTPEGR